MKFWKMHGLGNDFAVFDARAKPFTASVEWARRICDRHTGIGCDQIIILLPPKAAGAHVFIRFLNADGSEPEACGNGTRCIAALLLAEKTEPQFHIETIAGLLAVDASNPDCIMVDMGPAYLDWQQVPLAHEADTLAVPIAVEGFSGEAICVSMGNPHATFFVPDLDDLDFLRIGPLVETHAMFPARVNAGFAQITGPNRMRFKIWERGSGWTLACGSAACAAGVAAIRRELTDRRVTVDMELGPLTVEWSDDGHVLLGGPTALMFTGELSADLLP